MTGEDFDQRQKVRFADNDTGRISAQSFRDQADDIRATFALKGTGETGPGTLPVRDTNVVRFDSSAQYTTIYSGFPFSVDVASLAGSGVALILLYPMQYAPDLRDPIFEFSQGSVAVPNLKQLYMFLWGLDGKIQVVITPF
jgi:hypothetical protein